MKDTNGNADGHGLSDRERSLARHLGRTDDEVEPFGPGFGELGEWLTIEVLDNERSRIGSTGIDLIISLLGEDFPRATDTRQLASAALALSWLFGSELVETSMEIRLGDRAITWSVVDGRKFIMRTVTVDSDRPIPAGMRHWFEQAGIYQPKDFGLHRRWRTHGHIHGSTRKARFAAGSMSGRREFRVLPHLDRMDICDGNMDRWANSRGASVPMPRTQAEFEAALAELVERSASTMYRAQAQEAA